MNAQFRLRINSNKRLILPRHKARRLPSESCYSLQHKTPEVLKSQDNNDNEQSKETPHAAQLPRSIGRHRHDRSGWNRLRCKHSSTVVFNRRRHAVRNNVRDLRSRNSRDNHHRHIHFADRKNRANRLRPTTTRIKTEKLEAGKNLGRDIKETH